MKEAKIQTGLRLSEDQYERIQKIAGRAGVSLNAAILMMIEIGLTAYEHPASE